MHTVTTVAIAAPNPVAAALRCPRFPRAYNDRAFPAVVWV